MLAVAVARRPLNFDFDLDGSDVWVILDTEYRTNPRSLVEPWAIEVVQIWGLCRGEYGLVHLPDPGGMNDQAAWLLDAFDACASAESKLRAREKALGEDHSSLESDLQAVLAEGQSALAADLRRGMEAAAAAVQADLRGQTRAAGLGAGLEKAWQKQVYPRGAGNTLSPAALVYGKSKVLFQVFTEGATIVPKQGRFLAIPTREAEALGFARSNTTRGGGGAGSIPRRVSLVQQAINRLGAANISVVPARRGRKLMVYRVPNGRGAGLSFRGRIGFRRGQSVPLFILIPSVRLRARIDLDGVRSRANTTLAQEIGAALGN